MKTNYVLVDFENVQVPTLSRLKGEHFRVWLFLGPRNTRLKTELALSMLELHERLVPIRMKTSGKDALDFHIAYYLGNLVKEDPGGCFHNLREQQISIGRMKSVEAMPCLQPKTTRSVSTRGIDEDKRERQQGPAT